MKADCGNAAKKGKAEKGQRRAPPAQGNCNSLDRTTARLMWGAAPEISKMAIIVGKIVEVSRHPEAEKYVATSFDAVCFIVLLVFGPDADTELRLYVEKIDMGEKDLRTIVSGLVDFVPIDQMKVCIAEFCHSQ